MNNDKTTMEQLQMATDSYGTVIAYGDFVLASAYRHLGKGRIGNDARVYKLAQHPIPGWGPDARGFIECELDLVAENQPPCVRTPGKPVRGPALAGARRSPDASMDARCRHREGVVDNVRGSSAPRGGYNPRSCQQRASAPISPADRRQRAPRAAGAGTAPTTFVGTKGEGRPDRRPRRPRARPAGVPTTGCPQSWRRANSASTSTDTPRGRAATPTALRAWAEPKTSPNSSEAPLTTPACP